MNREAVGIMAKRTNDRPIKAAIDEMLNQFHLKEKMNKVQLIQSWEKVMGPAVAHRTTELMIIDKKLFVSLSSASLRQELFQDRDKITQLLNTEAGAVVIDEIVFR
ncbi:MAG: DUF721 domain-containing protein [Bacteroidetes bacterium]|jgi:molybdopterin synthase catalytic subunit|nr:DUF721 domain-containing protein [Bacteroidota bacterium]MBP6650445.1 DUF721 domain-containing protein [Bacteroidia bacterium]